MLYGSVKDIAHQFSYMSLGLLGTNRIIIMVYYNTLMILRSVKNYLRLMYMFEGGGGMGEGGGD